MEAIASRDSTKVGELVSESAETFTVKRTTLETIETRKGFGVDVSLVYAGDDEPNPDEPVAFDIFIVEITPSECQFLIDGSFCVKIGGNAFIPVENFGDDEDDLSADRFFETYEEALNHSAYVRQALKFNGLDDYS